MGDPEKIGIKDIDHPDYGDPVEIREGEIPVFWACGVTPQAAVERAKPPIVITHARVICFITNVKNAELNDYLEKKEARYEIAVKQKGIAASQMRDQLPASDMADFAGQMRK